MQLPWTHYHLPATDFLQCYGLFEQKGNTLVCQRLLVLSDGHVYILGANLKHIFL